MSNKPLAAFVICMALAFAIPIGLYFTSVLPAQVQYERTFGGQVSITIDQPTTSGMSHGLTKIWQQMNSTFGTDNHDTIYGSGLYWEQTPDNSLASQDRYFRSEIARLDNYTAAYRAYQEAGTQTVTGLPLIDWYDKVVTNSRAELQRNGGLDWAISGAWYLKYAPFAYWFWVYVIGIIVGLSALGFLLAYALSLAEERERERRYRGS